MRVARLTVHGPHVVAARKIASLIPGPRAGGPNDRSRKELRRHLGAHGAAHVTRCSRAARGARVFRRQGAGNQRGVFSSVRAPAVFVTVCPRPTRTPRQVAQRAPLSNDRDRAVVDRAEKALNDRRVERLESGVERRCGSGTAITAFFTRAKSSVGTTWRRPRSWRPRRGGGQTALAGAAPGGSPCITRDRTRLGSSSPAGRSTRGYRQTHQRGTPPPPHRVY